MKILSNKYELQVLQRRYVVFLKYINQTKSLMKMFTQVNLAQTYCRKNTSFLF